MTQSELRLATSKGLEHVSGYTADQIDGLLAKKHETDLYVSQCKNGPTWSSQNLLILDAWALKRTYSPLSIIGYEIKVSRHDFEQDQKWTGYLDVCHYFNFVCPAGLIRATDLPVQAGLIWVSQSGTLHVKHKAERLKPDPTKLNSLLIYILMARAKITNTYFPPNGGEEPLSHLDGLKRVVEDAKKRQELAYFIKSHVQEHEKAVQQRESQLKPREDAIMEFKDRLARLGIEWNTEKNIWEERWKVDSDINALRKAIDGETLLQLERTAQQMLEACKTIRSLHKEPEKVRTGLG